MASSGQEERELDSYTIAGSDVVIQGGDRVLLRPDDAASPPYVAVVERILLDSEDNVQLLVRWYYRPEDSLIGRQCFHGAKELFLSDHYDMVTPHSIERKCTVHSFRTYTKMKNVGVDDYFCRFQYKACTGDFTPESVVVYCKCEMPYNPDHIMIQCQRCVNWFHPWCMGLTIDEARNLERFLCDECIEEARNLGQQGYQTSRRG